ncbi:hypothetical protein IFM89_017259 [Coptis chinensis]|uniref:Uncharacterized protein n=1 Tax=Coptis chinensis TaxID=261450 RepID=A0A835LS02_9MAGN|nr:hypothetical protein IFM89_017259 [Coptis chinensis]
MVNLFLLTTSGFMIRGLEVTTATVKTDLQYQIRNSAKQRKHREGISGLEFDSKGIYLASVTKSGCLAVHDFEALYCLSNGLSALEDESKHLIHLSTGQRLDVVRWNLANQDEVACTSMTSNEVRIFDIGYVSSDPIEVLRKRPTVTVNGCKVPRGLCDIAFSSSDKSRPYLAHGTQQQTDLASFPISKFWVEDLCIALRNYHDEINLRIELTPMFPLLLASDMYGVINLWDRRMSNFPCVELTSNTHSPLNSIQLSLENQIVFGAGKHGTIYAWDLRGGRTSVAFQNNKEVYHPPLSSVKLAPLLGKIRLLKEQSDIVTREICSIDLDPSASYQLAFHLDNGWSGVVDTRSSQVTHIHCPPPAWLNGVEGSFDYGLMRKPAWLPTCSIYAVGSTFDNGIHLLDFYPVPTSVCHVDFNEEMQEISTEITQNRFVPLSETVTACASHPLNGTIIAGTKTSSMLVISQKSCSENRDLITEGTREVGEKIKISSLV